MICVPRRKCLHLFMTFAAFAGIVLVFYAIELTDQNLRTKHSLMANDTTEERSRINSTLVTTEKQREIRLLCWLLCDPGDKRVVNVKNTWAKRCDIMLYMSSVENKTFPTIGLNVSAGRDHIASKSKAAWKHIHKNYLDKADFFVKADPDTYIVVENMKRFLQDKNTSAPEYYGHMMVLSKVKYASGGPGIVLTRESVRRLVEVAFKAKVDCMPDGQFEDFKTGKCLKSVGVRPVNTKDRDGKEMFFIFGITTHINGNWPKWYLQYTKNYTSSSGLDNCCSDYPVSFHYVSSSNFYMLEYFFYRSHISH